MTIDRDAAERMRRLAVSHLPEIAGRLMKDGKYTDAANVTAAAEALLSRTEATGAAGGSKSTVDFVREWMMSGDHDVSAWERQFAAAIDARSASAGGGELREALERLEEACDRVAASRPQAAYLAMIDGGQEDDLLALDEARSAARAALSAKPAGVSPPAPVAYLHQHPKYVEEIDREELLAADREDGWTSTPLYAHPSAPSGEGLREALIAAGDALSGCEYATIIDTERAGRALAKVRAALSTSPAPKSGDGV